MQLRGRTITALDIAIATVAVLVIVLGAWLGWSVWSANRRVVEGTPASRAIAGMAARVKKEPGNVALRLQLAQALVVAGRESEAIPQYRAVLDAQKDNVNALAGLGFVSSKRKDWKTAEGYWRRIIELREPLFTASQDSSLETAYFYLATVLSEQRRYDEAIPYFKAALRIKRDASDTYYALAVAYRETDSPEQYQENLQIALAFDPLMPEANYDLGQLLLEEGNVAGAAERFRISSDAAPYVDKPREALEALGPFDERLAKAEELASSDPKAALIEARVAVALEPEDPEALALAADLYEVAKDKVKALELWKRVQALDSKNATATAAIERLTPGAK